MFYQFGENRDFILFELRPTKVEYTATDSIFTPSTLHIAWNVSGVPGFVELGKGLDKNIEYKVTFKPGSSSVNTSIELGGPSVTLSSQLPKEILAFRYRGPLIAGSTGSSRVDAFVGCLASGTNILLDPNGSGATDVKAGCPLDSQSGCPKRSK